MKLLLKLLGVSDYIKQLEKLEAEDTKTITELLDKNDKLTLTNKELTVECNNLRQQITNIDRLKDKLIEEEQLVLDKSNTINKLLKLNEQLNKELTNLTNKFNQIKEIINYE